ncbi:polysaccharide deacetylase family protein [Maribacter chungangensis]|uniref:Polysaccharide deacetylase family protein n=1 Tax=Maribacter chungangensis TaxID=1069117 RepID=A0ABW3B1H7_9FLAO
MKQIFTKILGIDIGFTTTIEDFIKHTDEKITYTKQPLQNEFFIRSNDLLFEQGINDIQIQINDWEGTPCFFPTGERSAVPFDVFAASFYLLSRYEEYLPHVKDIHGRFSPKDSIAYQNDFLHRPVIDIWALKLLELLKEKFPELLSKQRKYNFLSVLDVTTSHSYANRGLFRGLAGFLLDLGTFKLKRVWERIMVGIKRRKDPYDNFEQLIAWHQSYGVKSIFFFQFADYSKYDKNVSTNSNRFKSLIKYIADYSKVALAASYSSFSDIELLKKEKNNLENVINRPVTYSRMRYNRVDVPQSYRNLVTAEFTNDFTMGYTSEIGFRAGTCTPFQFYDIPLEVQQPVKVHPFALHDYALVTAKSEKQIEEKIKDIYTEIKNVEGAFVTVFSNELLGGEENFDWKRIYKNVITAYNV